VNFGNVQKVLDEQGNLLDENYIRRVDKFLNEFGLDGARPSLRT
jgi:hypothetical protein